MIKDTSISILCVDDDLGFRRYLRQSLDPRFQIRYFALGFECLTRLQDTHFDLILVDATLPDMPSDQLVDKLKAMPNLSQTPVIIVSYKDSEQERKRFARCQCDGFLSKVASPAEITERLGKALHRAA
ncbi:MAG TPA: response regulator [Dongiaceae bacterium]|nr:response regulator [Dongiaceae bacterium]